MGRAPFSTTPADDGEQSADGNDEEEEQERQSRKGDAEGSISTSSRSPMKDFDLSTMEHMGRVGARHEDDEDEAPALVELEERWQQWWEDGESMAPPEAGNGSTKAWEEKMATYHHRQVGPSF